MAEAATQPADASPKGRGRLFVIIGVVVGLLAVLAAVWFLFLSGGDAGEDGEPVAEEPMFSTEEGPIVHVDETTVSLGGDEPHFAMVTYSAVLAMDADPALVEARLDRLRSQAQIVFRGYEAELLDTPEGFQQLQSDLTVVAQQLWPDGEVLEILVTELLVQ